MSVNTSKEINYFVENLSNSFERLNYDVGSVRYYLFTKKSEEIY